MLLVPVVFGCGWFQLALPSVATFAQTERYVAKVNSLASQQMQIELIMPSDVVAVVQPSEGETEVVTEGCRWTLCSLCRLSQVEAACGAAEVAVAGGGGWVDWCQRHSGCGWFSWCSCGNRQ